MLTILFIGDISGKPGRGAVARLLGPLRDRCGADLVIANAENAAGGIGLTKPTAIELLDAGIDVITLGNHAFAKPDIHALLDHESRVIRPANYPSGAPGKGWREYKTASGRSVAVVNLVGRVFMNPVDCPFACADAILDGLPDTVRTIVVDMHAEATSEKMAMGWHLDGRASAVIGTHTHIQTSDERVLPHGTAYLTDVGMTGVHDSVLGLDKDAVLERFLTGMPGKFAMAQGEATLQAAIIRIDPQSGHALGIERISVRENEVL